MYNKPWSLKLTRVKYGEHPIGSVIIVGKDISEEGAAYILQCGNGEIVKPKEMLPKENKEVMLPNETHEEVLSAKKPQKNKRRRSTSKENENV